MSHCRRWFDTIYCPLTRSTFRIALRSRSSKVFFGARIFKMRKTRLVILPTKCLNKMGFLLLFLSCPVIGDWGRIRPESENSHRAIQVEREGTCGLQRDPPGKLLDLLERKGSDQCRLSESDDFANQPTIEGKVTFNRRIDDTAENRYAREFLQRRVVQQRRGRGQDRTASAEVLKNVRNTETRHVVDSLRSVARSRSLDRTNRATIRGIRSEKSRELRLERFRRELESETRATRQRLSQARQTIGGENKRNVHEKRVQNIREARRVASQRRETDRRLRAASNTRTASAVRRSERRNDVRMSRASERRESERTIRYTAERQENNERFQERTAKMKARQNDLTREERKSGGRRLSLARNELKENQRSDNRRFDADLKTKSFVLGKVQRMGEKLASSRRETAIRRSVSREKDLSDTVRNHIYKTNIVRAIRQTIPTTKHFNLEPKTEGSGNFFNTISTWMGLENYETSKVAGWTTNCALGAVAYFLTFKRVKTV